MFMASALLVSVAQAQLTTFNWTGAVDQFWDKAENWNPEQVPNKINSSVVKVETSQGLTNGYSLQMGKSKSAHTLYVNLSRFALTASNSKTLRIGSGGKIHFDKKYTGSGATGNAFSSTSVKHRIWISGRERMTLRNDGSGIPAFNFASLQNDNLGAGDLLFVFEGTGSWLFRKPAYLGRQALAAGSETDSPNAVSIELAEDQFSGVISYQAERPMQVAAIKIGSGTLRLEDSVINIDEGGEGVLVYPKGRFSGSGEVNGPFAVAGELDVGYAADPAQLKFSSKLFLANSAKVTLRIFGNNADSIVLSGQNQSLTLGGTLELQAIRVPDKDASWQIIKADTAAEGAFKAVNMRTDAFQTADNGSSWTFAGNGGLWQLDSKSGVLSFSKR